MKELETLVYGLQKGGNRLIHISNANRGLSCGCVCPNCKENLIAKRGEINSHHFAHESGADCGGGAESAAHLMGKSIVKEHGFFAPAYTLKSGKTFKGKRIIPEHAVIESRRYGRIFDIEVQSAEGTFFVEVKNTHAVSEEKIKVITGMNMPCLEIDVSGRVSNHYDEIYRIVMDERCFKRWLTPMSLFKEDPKKRLKALLASTCDECHRPVDMTFNERDTLKGYYKIISGDRLLLCSECYEVRNV